MLYVVRSSSGPVLLRKAKIKGHYRRLKNGKIIYIDQYFDKRKEAQKELAAHEGKVVHADEKGTSVVHVNDKGGHEIHHTPHEEGDELRPNEIHGEMTARVASLTEGDAVSLLQAVYGLDKPKEGEDQKNLRDQIGKIASKASDLEAQFNALDDEKKVSQEGGALQLKLAIARAIVQSADGVDRDKPAQDAQYEVLQRTASALRNLPIHMALEEIEEEPKNLESHVAALYQAYSDPKSRAEFVKYMQERQASYEKAKTVTPKDAPTVPGFNYENIKMFDHQAECMAKLNVLYDGIIDVDMGGGKGLLLPMDAANLMHQGKVRRPIIFVPGMTLDQNADKITSEYFPDAMNVFKIDNKLIAQTYDNDIEALLEDIKAAPPNTIFMCSYSVLGYSDALSYKNSKIPQKDRRGMKRAFDIARAGFDYVACDESHNIKNLDTGVAAGLRYFGKATYRRCASGTVLSNNPVDVLGQMAFTSGKYIPEEAFKKAFGYNETATGRVWEKSGVKKLRQFMIDHGAISIRRSAWIDKLPKRNEKLHVLPLTPKIALANELAINDTLDAIEEMAASDPKLAKELKALEAGKDDDLDNADESGGMIAQAVLRLTELTDAPKEFGEFVGRGLTLQTELKPYLDEATALMQLAHEEAQAEGRKGKNPDSISGWNSIVRDAIAAANNDIRAANKGKSDDELLSKLYSSEDESALKIIRYFGPKTLRAIENAKDEVSPKALDFYAKAKAHMADPKNGKIMLFCQRRKSAQHVIENAPAELKKHMVYYDASRKEDLKQFLDEGPDSPKILVAVDQSIKEGVNMQLANMLYRYDMHYSPGNTEQSYARIWRFGQKRDADIHIGICDKSLDVTKYARAMAKYDTNMKVVSNYEGDESMPAMRLNLRNLRQFRSFSDLDPQVTEVTKNVLSHEMAENKEIAAKYKKEGYKSPAKGAESKLGEHHGAMGLFHPAYHFKADKLGDPVEKDIGNLDDALRHGHKNYEGLEDADVEEILQMRTDLQDLHRYLQGRHPSKASKKALDYFWRTHNTLHGLDTDEGYKDIIQQAAAYLHQNGVKDKAKNPILERGSDEEAWKPVPKSKARQVDVELEDEEPEAKPKPGETKIAAKAAVPKGWRHIGSLDNKHYIEHTETGSVKAGPGHHPDDYKHVAGRSMWLNSPLRQRLLLRGKAKGGAAASGREGDITGIVRKHLKDAGIDPKALDNETLMAVVQDARDRAGHAGTKASFWQAHEKKHKAKSSDRHKKVVEAIAAEIAAKKPEAAPKAKKAPAKATVKQKAPAKAPAKAAPKADHKANMMESLKHHKIDPKKLDAATQKDVLRDIEGLHSHLSSGGKEADFWQALKKKEKFDASANHKKVVSRAAKAGLMRKAIRPAVRRPVYWMRGAL